MLVRRLVPVALAAALVPAAPASAAAVYATGTAVRDPLRPRTAIGTCLAVGVGATVELFECGFAGEGSAATIVTAGVTSVATFTGLIGEQPKSLCWKGVAVAIGTSAAAPFEGCTLVS